VIQRQRGKTAFLRVSQHVRDHLAVDGWVAHDAVLADLFAPGLKLRLDQADHAGAFL